MQDLSDWDRLDAAGFYVSVMRSVRRVAWFSVGIGLFVASCGLAALPSPALIIVGLGLAATGLWNLIRPSPTGMLVDSLAMIGVGVFNCLMWLWVPGQGGTHAGRAAFAGLMQIAWGISRLKFYPVARQARAAPDVVARLESIVRDLRKRKASDPAVVEFATGSFPHKRNRIGLFPEGAVGLLENYEAVRLARRGAIWIESRGTGSMLGRSVKVAVHMDDLELTGSMSEEHFQRFEGWKLGMSGPIAA